MNFLRKIERLEEKLGIKSGPYPHVILTNIRWGDDAIELVPGIYIETFSRALTPAEFEQERANWKREHRVADEL